MNILILGDIVGPSDRKAIINKLPDLIKNIIIKKVKTNNQSKRLPS